MATLPIAVPVANDGSLTVRQMGPNKDLGELRNFASVDVPWLKLLRAVPPASEPLRDEERRAPLTRSTSRSTIPSSAPVKSAYPPALRSPV